MRFFGEDPAQRQQLMSVLMVAAAAPGFWDLIKWIFVSIKEAFTGKKKTTMDGLSDQIKTLADDNKAMHSDISDLKNDASQQKDRYDADRAKDNRAKILRFSDECRRGDKHSLEYFDDILSVIKEYEDYCREHPDFPNRKAVSAINRIQEAYDSANKNNDFI